MVKKTEFAHGHASINDFFAWINERHSIYVKRSLYLPFPWTQDPVLREAKFTNVFRQLDKGTVALTEMLKGQVCDEFFLWNVIWYRLFNWYLNGENIGFSRDFHQWEEDIRHCEARARVFTNAHMTWGEPGRPKIDTNVDAMRETWGRKESLFQQLRQCSTMEEAFGIIRTVKGVGPFIAYEIVCDLRWYPVWKKLRHPTDIYRWANIGPGAKRGLQRLGLEVDIESLRWLWRTAADPGVVCACGEKSICAPCGCRFHVEWDYDEPGLSPLVIPHHPIYALRYQYGHGVKDPPFELREIEHSLCEFDKYCRIAVDGGRAKSRYRHES